MGELIRVPIAGIGIGHRDDILFTVVGSCVAIMLYDKKYAIGGMIHIVLGYSKNREEPPAKYADTGIPYLIQKMTQQGASAHRLKAAKITGGGEMFEVLNSRNSVSRKNIRDVQEVLAQHGITIIASDLGGKTGRRVSFDVATGKVNVIVGGQRDVIL